MLIEFSAANFKSIRDRQTLSMVASSGGEMRDSHTFTAPMGGKSDIRLLRSAVIYGANASGKSNFLDALGTMFMIVGTSATESLRGSPVPVTPFRLDPAARNKPSEFEINFIAGGVRYQYGFSATQERVLEEWLLAYPHGRVQRWLGRVWVDKKEDYEWLLGANLKGEKNVWKNATRENALFLSTAVQLNSRQLLSIYKWFTGSSLSMIRERLMDSFLSTGSNTTSVYCERGGKEEVVEFLRHADLDIYDVKLRPRSLDALNKISGRYTAGAFSDFPKNFHGVMDQDEMYEVRMIHNDIKNQPVEFDLDDESDGTRQLYCLAGHWLTCLKNGLTVAADELDEHLHPKLVQYLVGLFNNEKTNPNNAQLIFVTHETAFMDKNFLRRDQVWFCEINSKLATEVYPLTDFHPRKGRGNLRAAYLSGGYGALPHLEAVEG